LMMWCFCMVLFYLITMCKLNRSCYELFPICYEFAPTPGIKGLLLQTGLFPGPLWCFIEIFFKGNGEIAGIAITTIHGNYFNSRI
jgi:hypothetical protein